MADKFGSIHFMILVSSFALAAIAESIWPLRNRTQSRAIRTGRNLGLATIGAVIVRFAFFPLVISASGFVTENQIGLLNWLKLPPALSTIVAIALLDYSLYYWHLVNHRVPFLWRFHMAHHTDLDLDVSTASRFHFGELGFSACYRIVQMFVLGINIPTLLLFEACVTVAAIFHHSNSRLPEAFEKFFTKIFVAPRMHGIHHSIVREETNANFGVILTIWDRIHGTLKLNVTQDKIIIGVPKHREFSAQKISDVLLTPFRSQ